MECYLCLEMELVVITCQQEVSNQFIVAKQQCNNNRNAQALCMLLAGERHGLGFAKYTP